MSALPARAATAGSLALALALALPAVAFADEDRGRSQSGAPQGEQRSEERGRSQTAPHGEAEGGSERGDEDGGEDGGEDGAKATAETDKGGKADEGRAAGGDPRGNNGTVKIDGVPLDDGRGNEPHVGCVFQVDFYGFDAEDTASITFTGQAPTGGGLLHSETATAISDDAAGGGQDRDATLTFSVDGQLSELKAIAPHPQQGWHVKLEVDVDSAPGGAKSKVFWIDCPQEAATGGASTETETDTRDAVTTNGTTAQGGGAGTVTAQGTTAVTVLPATVVSGTTVAAAERQEALALGAGETTLGTVTLAAGGSEAATAAEGAVAAQGAVAPSVLPFTGSAVLLYLLGLGASAVGVGAIAHRMGRSQADLV